MVVTCHNIQLFWTDFFLSPLFISQYLLYKIVLWSIFGASILMHPILQFVYKIITNSYKIYNSYKISMYIILFTSVFKNIIENIVYVLNGKFIYQCIMFVRAMYRLFVCLFVCLFVYHGTGTR